MSFVRLAQRVFDKSAIECRFENFDAQWESKFSRKQLEEGRKLYTAGSVRILELHSDYASINLKLEDASEPYCIIDFEGRNFSIRGSSSDDSLNATFAVAGMYEIEELIADQISPLKYIPKKKVEEEKEAESIPQKLESISEKIDEKARKPYLIFKVKKDVLSFTANWKTESGLRSAFGKNSISASELKIKERESLVRIASFARKAGFNYDGKSYECSDTSKFPLFCSDTLRTWRRFFEIENNPDLDLLSKGVRELDLSVNLDFADDDDFSINADFYADFDGEKIGFDDLKFLQGAGVGGRFVSGKGLLKISNDELKKFSNARRTLDIFGGKIPNYMIFTLFDEFAKSKLSQTLKNWKNTISTSVENLRLPDFLREYQKDAVLRAVSLFKSGCAMLLADEMGLGKTVQTLSLINNYWDLKNNFLIVCPASVIPVWKGEVEKFYPHIVCKELDSSSNFDSLESSLVLASYTQLRRNRQKLDSVNFKLAVLDEAQYIKNPDSKVSQACSSIRSEYRLALTGTPIENRLLDMWSIFRWLMPGLLGHKSDFESRLQVDKNFPDLLKRQISPFVLRRLKKDVLAELPAKNFVDLLCPMSNMQAVEYGKLIEQARESVKSGDALNPRGRVSILSTLTRLRQVACDPSLLPWVERDTPLENSGKIQALSDALSSILANGSKVVIFSQFTSFLERIEKMVAEKFPEVKTFELTGSTKDRSSPVSSFQNAQEASIIFVSLRAGGTGITLTNADYVFLVDPWWNPAVEEQAIDRVHRIGKKSDVFIYRLITDSSVEQSVRKLQLKKKSLFEDILGGINSGKSFDEAISEILEL